MSESNIPTKAVVIYHDNCVDGFASAWAFKRLAEKDYKDGVIYVPAQYDKPLIRNELWDIRSDIFILDFSFSRNIITNYARAFASVTVLDHHKTAAEALSGWDHGFSNLEIVFDMSRSGAGISWDYFSEGQLRPELIDYVEDRDIWKWELPDSKEINSLIGFTKKEFDAYDRLHELLESRYDAAVGMGSLLLEQQQRHVQSIITTTKRPIKINGKHGLICNCPGQFASDVGNELAKMSGTFGATCYQGSDEKIHFSLRSIGDYDVSAMARDFGGGGHKNAAGFVMEIISENPGGSGVVIYNTGLGDLEGMTDGNS